MSKTATLTLAPTKPIDLEKLSADQMSHSATFDADAIGERAKAMLNHVEQLKTERAQKAILAGIYLHQVKVSLGHGSFRSWMEKHFPKGKDSVARYMALAAKFCRSSKLLLPELIGANQLSLALEAKDQTGEAFKAKLATFVGQSGLTDLMQKHQVIKRGGPKPRGEHSADQPDTAETEADPTAEAFKSGFDAIDLCEKTLTDEVFWSAITPDLAKQLEAKLRSVTEHFHDRALKLRHEHAA